MYRVQKPVTKEALVIFKRDRRREIDAVIDYFGEARTSPALQPRSAPDGPRYVTASDRFACATPGEALGFPER